MNSSYLEYLNINIFFITLYIFLKTIIKKDLPHKKQLFFIWQIFYLLLNKD